MKKTILFLAFLASIQISSQNLNKVQVFGKIIVEGNDLSGITIYNVTSKTGTITDDFGKFSLRVSLDDIIEVSALQYQNITFKVNSSIIESQKMKIFLINEINILDEIVITGRGLTGDLKKDISTTSNFKPKLDALYFGVKHATEYDFEKDNKSAVKNIAVNLQQQTMVNGLNIVNIVDQLLLPLFRSEAKSKKESGVPEVPVESIKYYFGSEFLVDNFNIPEHRVTEFIRFVERDNFDFSLLNYGKEMEFLEFLNDKSIEFLTTKD